MPRRRKRPPGKVVAMVYTDPHNPQIDHTVIYHDVNGGPPPVTRAALGLREVVEGAWDGPTLACHLRRFTTYYRHVAEPIVVGTHPTIAWLPSGTQVTTIRVPVSLR